MSPRKLLIQAAVVGVLLVAMNGVVWWLSANTVPRQLLRRCEQVEKPATDVFLGNSTMAAGVDEMAFDAAWPGRKALNAGLGATSPVEHLLIQSRLARHHRGAVTYYGFCDTQLTEPVAGDWATLVGNRAMAYYVEPELALRYYAPDDTIAAARFRLVGRVPTLVERYAIWAKVERVRRALAEVGMPKRDVNRFGRAEDFALLEAGDEAEFARVCGRAATAGAPLNPAVASLLRNAKENGGAAVVVEMPMRSVHRKRFNRTPEWAAYRAHLAGLISEADAEYVQAADWVPDEGFADALHLDAAGAKVFTERLAMRQADRR